MKNRTLPAIFEDMKLHINEAIFCMDNALELVEECAEENYDARLNEALEFLQEVRSLLCGC